MQMTTEVPDELLTPGRVESPIGTLSFRDGVPDAETARLVDVDSAMLFRLYGPLQPWFDKTWRPGVPELVEGA